MATVGIARAAGYTDYSSGSVAAFIPELWSTKMTTKFYNTTVFGEICDTSYEGEIARMGDKVYIRRTPDINVSPYQVGQTISYQVPNVAATQLIIAYGLYWAYQIDNIDRYQSDINLMDNFSQDAVQKVMIAQDQNLLATVPGLTASSNSGVNAGFQTGNINLGAPGAPLVVTSANIINYVFLAAGQALDENKVPRDGKRWIVIPSWAIRMMKASELKYAYETGDAVSPLRNGRVGRTDDFIIYQSNNYTPYVSGSLQVWPIIFGHPAGLAWASQFLDTDAVKLVNQIGIGVYSVCGYGFNVVEPTYVGYALCTPGLY
jgi:hypothetical protein